MVAGGDHDHVSFHIRELEIIVLRNLFYVIAGMSSGLGPMHSKGYIFTQMNLLVRCK